MVKWVKSSMIMCFFFFQAEDGIRDSPVTGVQTCALPIYLLDERITDFTDYVRNTLQHAAGLSAADLSTSLLRVDQVRRQMEIFFDDYDLLLTPTMPVTAFPIDDRPTIIGGKEVNPFWGYLPFTFPINMTGQTAANVPCGFSQNGMPVGLHIIAPKCSEALVLRASSAFEMINPWIHHRPSEL